MRYRRITIEGASYFFTLVTQQRRPLFANPAVVELLDGAIETSPPTSTTAPSIRSSIMA